MVSQSALTIISEIKPERKVSLRQLLTSMRGDAARNGVIPFGKLSNVHFARLLVLDEDLDLKGGPIPGSLIFMCDLDGSLERFLRHLVHVAGAGLDEIYGHCEGYPSPEENTSEKRLAYLHAKMVTADAMYVNTIGRSAQQIRQEARLREAIQQFLDQQEHDWSGRGPLEVRAAIQRFVDGEESLHWSKKPPKRPSLSWRLREGLHFVSVLLLLLALLPVTILVLPFWLVLLRVHELTDSATDTRPDEQHVVALAALEDHAAHNQFSAMGYRKPGWFRKVTATAVLWLINYGARHVLNKGNLAGVKTIHFARWVFLNEKRRLIFTSSYDGSLESYMSDFIDKVAWGLNASFSNGVDYPRTNWLVMNGATNEQAFKRYIRNHQLPTDFWYSAYENLTALNIKRNAEIRAGLYGPMGDGAAEEWLRLL